jgi:hypothetical protein
MSDYPASAIRQFNELNPLSALFHSENAPTIFGRYLSATETFFHSVLVFSAAVAHLQRQGLWIGALRDRTFADVICADGIDLPDKVQIYNLIRNDLSATPARQFARASISAVTVFEYHCMLYSQAICRLMIEGLKLPDTASLEGQLQRRNVVSPATLPAPRQ